MEELVIEGCAGILMERAINMQGGLAALLAYLRGEAIEGLQELDLTPRAAAQAAVVEPLPRPAGSLCLGDSSCKTHRAGGGRREGLGCGQARMTAVPEGVERLPSLTTLKIGLHSIGSGGASTLAKLQRLTALDVNSFVMANLAFTTVTIQTGDFSNVHNFVKKFVWDPIQIT
jgi:hypothetical protein